MTRRKVEANISLDGWDLPKLSNKIEDITDKTRNKIEKAFEEFTDSFYEKKIENLIKDTVSEFLKYAAKDGFSLDLFPRKGKPGDLHFHVYISDYDYINVDTNLRKELKEVIKAWLDEDGYIINSKEDYFIQLAKEYRELAHMVESKIRKKDQ